MQTLFISLELWEIVEEGFEEISIEDSTEKEEKEYKKYQKKNLRYIQQGVSKSIFHRIFELENI